MTRKNLLIVIGLTLFLVLSIFLGGKMVREGTMLFGRATAPTPSPSPLLQPIYFPSPTPTPKTYNLQDFSRMIDALGTSNPEFDLNNDGIVNQADINIFKQRYQ